MKIPSGLTTYMCFYRNDKIRVSNFTDEDIEIKIVCDAEKVHELTQDILKIEISKLIK